VITASLEIGKTRQLSEFHDSKYLGHPDVDGFVYCYISHSMEAT